MATLEFSSSRLIAVYSKSCYIQKVLWLLLQMFQRVLIKKSRQVFYSREMVREKRLVVQGVLLSVADHKFLFNCIVFQARSARCGL